MTMDSYCLTSNLSLFGRQLACNIRRTTLMLNGQARRGAAGTMTRLFAMLGMLGTVMAAGALTAMMIKL